MARECFSKFLFSSSLDIFYSVFNNKTLTPRFYRVVDRDGKAKIPYIIHQIWKNKKLSTYSTEAVHCRAHIQKYAPGITPCNVFCVTLFRTDVVLSLCPYDIATR